MNFFWRRHKADYTGPSQLRQAETTVTVPAGTDGQGDQEISDCGFRISD
jgi:hypothetical protein